FTKKLKESSITVEALVVNRLHPRFGGDTASDAAGADRARADSLQGTPLAPLYRNLAGFRHVAEREEAHLADLTAQVAPAPVARVPFLANDVHDLSGLLEIGTHLFH